MTQKDNDIQPPLGAEYDMGLYDEEDDQLPAFEITIVDDDPFNDDYDEPNSEPLFQDEADDAFAEVFDGVKPVGTIAGASGPRVPSAADVPAPAPEPQLPTEGEAASVFDENIEKADEDAFAFLKEQDKPAEEELLGLFDNVMTEQEPDSMLSASSAPKPSEERRDEAEPVAAASEPHQTEHAPSLTQETVVAPPEPPVSPKSPAVPTSHAQAAQLTDPSDSSLQQNPSTPSAPAALPVTNEQPISPEPPSHPEPSTQPEPPSQPDLPASPEQDKLRDEAAGADATEDAALEEIKEPENVVTAASKAIEEAAEDAGSAIVKSPKKKRKDNKKKTKRKRKSPRRSRAKAGEIDKHDEFVYDKSKSKRFGFHRNKELDQFHDFRVEELRKKNSTVKVKPLPGFNELAMKSGGKAGSTILAKVVNVEGTTKPKDKFRLVRRSRVVYENDLAAIQRRFRPSRIRAGIVYAFCLAVLAWAGVQLIQYFQETGSAQDDFQEIAEAYTVEEPLPVEEQGPDMMSWPPIIDFKALKADNPDVSGWIRIPGTSVDYPVMTNPDQEYYLHHDMHGQRTISGAIYADHESAKDLNENNHIVIYGHHMVTKTMFHDVASYSDKGFFDSHRVAYLETPETTYVLKVVAMYTVQPEEYTTRTVKFNTTQQFQSYFDDRVVNRSDYIKKDDWDRATADRFVTLITCNSSGSARQIVECVVEQEYPTSMIPNVIDRALSDWDKGIR